MLKQIQYEATLASSKVKGKFMADEKLCKNISTLATEFITKNHGSSPLSFTASIVEEKP